MNDGVVAPSPTAVTVPLTTATTSYHEQAKQSLLHWGLLALVVVALLVLALASEVFLMAFAGVLVAVALNEAMGFLNRTMGMDRKWALAVIVMVMALLLMVSLLFLVPTLAVQIEELRNSFPTALERFRDWAQDRPWLIRLLDRLPTTPEEVPAGEVAAQVGAFLTRALSIGGGVILVAFLGILFALQSKLYLGGFLRLLPLGSRDRVGEVLERVGTALKWWLVARAISMATIGTLTWIGLYFLGVDYAFTLAVLAATMTFVPYFGPVLALLPALGAGLAVDMSTAMWVLGLYAAIQVLETYFVTPLAEYQAASLPPALTITTQLTMAILAGPLGFVLADPMLAAAMVVIRLLYVEDVLNDRAPVEKAPSA